MGTGSKIQSTLRATLCEIERGLFRARYLTPPSGTNARDLPVYQVAVSATDAKLWIEESARALGYHTIVWEEGNPHQKSPLLSGGYDRSPDEREAALP